MRRPPSFLWHTKLPICVIGRDGGTFRPQHPIGRFMVDVWCLERRLAIEVAGAIHGRQRERDAEREALLAGAG